MVLPARKACRASKAFRALPGLQAQPDCKALPVLRDRPDPRALRAHQARPGLLAQRVLLRLWPAQPAQLEVPGRPDLRVLRELKAIPVLRVRKAFRVRRVMLAPQAQLAQRVTWDQPAL